jgi:TM2 domain-containing membrane protein YozV
MASFCTKCGRQIVSDGVFCSYCGASRRSVPAMPTNTEITATRIDAGRQSPQMSFPDPRATAIPHGQNVNILIQNRLYRNQPVVFGRSQSAGLAALLSFFWLGLGQIYTGQIIKGILMMVVHPILLVTGFMTLVLDPQRASIYFIVDFVLWVYGISNAYRTAERKNYELLSMPESY